MKTRKKRKSSIYDKLFHKYSSNSTYMTLRQVKRLMKHEFKIQSIDQKWNDTPTHWSDDRGYDMNLLHYTGGGNKVVMLDDYEKGKSKYLKP